MQDQVMKKSVKYLEVFIFYNVNHNNQKSLDKQSPSTG